MPVLGFAIEDEIEYNGCGIMKTDEPWKHLPRVFDLWVLALCTKGTMYMNIEGSEFAIRPGDVFILPVRRLHYGTRDSEGGISYYWAHFEAPDLDCLLERECVDARKIAPGQSYLMYHVSLLDLNTVSMLFNQLYTNNYAQHYTPNLQKSLLKVLLYEISNQTLYRHAHKFDQRFMQLLDHIRSNFTGELSVDELADLFSYNKSYLCRLFKARVGKNHQQLPKRAEVVLRVPAAERNQPSHQAHLIRGWFRKRKIFHAHVQGAYEHDSHRLSKHAPNRHLRRRSPLSLGQQVNQRHLLFFFMDCPSHPPPL